MTCRRIDSTSCTALLILLKSAQKNQKKKEIFSFAGAFKDMSQEDYDDFVRDTRKTRTGIFESEIKL